MEREIICPYCFAKTKESEVIFRANTGFTIDEINDRKRDGASDAEVRLMQLFLKFDDEYNRDEKLTRYWESRGGAAGYMNFDTGWDLPHIDPRNPAFRQMLLENPPASLNVGPDGMVRDQDGFILRVYDRFSDPTVPSKATRICPHCHNPYPLADYGKYQPMFISIVGITSCGKTVFLNQLLAKLPASMHNSGFAFGVHNLEEMNEDVRPDIPLPGSSDDKLMRRPLAINMQDPKNTKRGFTLVFYDIAGENCVRAKNKDTNLKQGIGNFIAECDALMFLIDPRQIPGFSREIPKVKEIGEVISVVQDIRTSLNGGPWTDVPVAVVLTKSDLLNNNPALADTPVFKWIDFREKGFGREDFFKINDCLTDHFNRNVEEVIANLAPFPKKGYFAVSAITCGVESRFKAYGNTEYHLDEASERKFKQVREWRRLWDMRDPESRTHFAECPVRDRNGNPIRFDPNEKITEANAKGIQTEVYADSEFERLYLDLWDIVSGNRINLVSYPKGWPNPRRVEEPLKWMLWRRKLIGPMYNWTEQPKKPLLMSKKKYEELLEQWRNENMRQERIFYEGGDPNEG